MVIEIPLSEKSVERVYECMGRSYYFDKMTDLFPYLCNNVKQYGYKGRKECQNNGD
jgi:hypothetical protein